MMITENGLGDFDIVEPGERINDIARIEYLRAHIEQCKLAITDGVDLLGYCVWSFTDVLSWLNGYQKRYGLVYVNRDENDSKDLKRSPKQSYFWYKSLIESNRQRF